jgi:hypothetical protein
LKKIAKLLQTTAPTFKPTQQKYYFCIIFFFHARKNIPDLGNFCNAIIAIIAAIKYNGMRKMPNVPIVSKTPRERSRELGISF